MIGVQNSYTLEFTPLGHYAGVQKLNKKNEDKKKEENVGQMDSERECSKCGNIGMSYTTMQLRSSDEGQTVFYFCPKCK